jgi:hypothetical protein
MYKIKDGVDLKSLRKYGFKIGREYPDNERCICNDHERDDYWLIPMDPDEPGKPWYADNEFDQLIWSIQIQPSRRLWIECVPSYTYHISNVDMEPMFYALILMIKDGLIEDDFDPNKYFS